MKMSTIDIKKRSPQAILAVIGLALTLRAFFPGIVSGDAVDQYQQATSFIFSDWHPPIMSFIWSIVNDWIPGPFGMLLLECVLYWGGLFLLSLSIPNTHRKLSLAVIVSGFMPFTVGTLSHIWKDVLHGVMWLFSVGIIGLYYYLDNEKDRRIKKLLLASGVMLAAGTMVRFNAIFGLLPLVWLLFSKINIQSWKKWVVILILFPACTILLTSVLNYNFLNAAKGRAYQSLIIFDIGGISHFSGKDYFEENWSNSEGDKVTSVCYNSSAWNVYAWGECKFVLSDIQASGTWYNGTLFKKWITAIYNEPGAYLHHRYGYFMNFLWNPSLILDDRTADNDLGFKFEKTGMFRTLEVTTNLLKDSFVFKPGFWLLASCLFSIYGVFAKKSFTRDMFLALNASSFLYLFAYLIVGVASDFRYAYWSILATSASIPFIMLSIKTNKSY
ncbi:hypothetical protein RI049_13580 [Cedecea neteri]|uniref:hypothetical protein n=1 Tax=Cedecea neteri TaxID=158822 RepID=UPI002AA7F076|nr:hypothetical protein [Cedecea neteri]WPU21124.1 hypothetical protein RI049_13580 [Cedecea neteri]